MFRESMVTKFPAAYFRLGKDETLLKEIACIFLEDTPELVRQIRQGTTEHNLDLVAHASHKLKGLVANIDENLAANVIQPVIDAARTRQSDQVRSLQMDLETQIGKLQREVRKCMESTVQ